MSVLTVASASRQLWPHFWTQPCLASLAFQSPVTCPFLAFRDCHLPGPETPLHAQKRFSAALATFLDTALPCKPCLPKPRHMSFLSVSRLPFARPETLLQALKPSRQLAKPRHMSFLTVSRLLFAKPETLLQGRKRFSAALATFLDTALPCKAPSHVLS